MERDFTNENFERFLRQNADGLRMRPSNKVWKGINQSLNRKRRKFAFFLGFSLLLTSVLGYYFIDVAVDNRMNASVNNSAPVASANSNSSITITGKQAPVTNNTTGNSVATNPSDIPGNGVTNQPFRNAVALQQDITTSDNVLEQAFSLTPFSSLISGALTAENTFQPTIVDSYPGVENRDEAPAEKEKMIAATDPLSIESVMNSYKPKIKTKKLGLQLFFTPTVSYRRLTENKAYTRTAGNSFQQGGVYNINNAVTHKPDLGFQVGLLAKYPISKKLKLRGGVQFNINRYDIKTFNSSWEVATIQLQNREELSAVTGYNNFSGYKSDWLENFYFQVAAPIGIEMKLSGNEKTQLGIATTIQPTYLLGDRAYLISQDYKNYMEVPWLVRNWNVNTSFETYVAYSTGKVKWQVGPQVRYQMLSSYHKKYPVKEHLFDFGLKVGVSLQ